MKTSGRGETVTFTPSMGAPAREVTGMAEVLCRTGRTRARTAAQRVESERNIIRLRMRMSVRKDSQCMVVVVKKNSIAS